MILQALEVLPEEQGARLGIRDRLVHGREDLIRGRFGSEPLGALSRKQPEDEVHPVGGQLEERLVHQVQLEIASPDVDDEHHLRLEGGDVGEVLLGTDAEVDAIDLRTANELGDHVLKEDLVRQEVVGSELAIGFRQLGDEGPVVAVGELVGKRRCDRADRIRRQPGEGQRENGDHEQERASRHAGADYTVDCRQSSVVSHSPQSESSVGSPSRQSESAVGVDSRSRQSESQASRQSESTGVDRPTSTVGSLRRLDRLGLPTLTVDYDCRL